MPEPLRVGLDARPALFGRTGFGRVVAETMRALRRRPDVELSPFGAAWRRPRPDAVGLGDVATPRLPARLQRLLAPLGFGVEHVLGPIDLFHHTDLVYAPVARVPEVLTIYDLVFLTDPSWHAPGFARRVEPRVRRRAAAAAAIVVPCTRVADAVLAHGVAPAERIHVASLGADHVDPTPRPDDRARLAAVLSAAGLKGAGPLVLLPGTREPRKNQAALLQAFLDVAGASAARLLFVGPAGWCCEDLERRLARLVAEGAAVGVAGEVDDDDLGVLLRCADVVAYPSLAEGFGLPVFEAMRCGRAVLTSQGTPMADLGGDAVELVDPRDPASMRAGLAGLLAAPERRAELGAAAAARVAGLTWDAHTDALVSVYRSALS